MKGRSFAITVDTVTMADRSFAITADDSGPITRNKNEKS